MTSIGLNFFERAAGINDAINADKIAMDPENKINCKSKLIGISAVPSGLRANVVKDNIRPNPNKTPKTAP